MSSIHHQSTSSRTVWMRHGKIWASIAEKLPCSSTTSTSTSNCYTLVSYLFTYHITSNWENGCRPQRPLYPRQLYYITLSICKITTKPYCGSQCRLRETPYLCSPNWAHSWLAEMFNVQKWLSSYSVGKWHKEAFSRERRRNVRLLVVDNLLWPSQRTGVSAGLGWALTYLI